MRHKLPVNKKAQVDGSYTKGISIRNRYRCPSMQQQNGHEAPPPQLLSMPQQDTQRILEVYVKRSLSLNDGSGKSKTVRTRVRRSATLIERRNGAGKHETSRSANLPASRAEAGPAQPAPPEASKPPEAAALPEAKAKKSGKKSKKHSFFRSFLNLFSRKTEKKEVADPEQETSGANTANQGSSTTPQSEKKIWRKRSMRKPSFRRHDSQLAKFTPVKRPTSLALSDTANLPNIVSVEPTEKYYEKLSEELAKIVKEVKETPVDEGHGTEIRRSKSAIENEAIQKIVLLLKQQGDIIDEKLKDNTSMNSIFQGLSYSSFQQIADHYVETETPEVLPHGTGGPELVRFAITLDVTAKMAGLSNQTVGRIMGLGNQYLLQRFTQMSMNLVSQDYSGQTHNSLESPQ
ncbi:uncharacterized protein [Paramormyrops kingsleyae]|uniref:uncharacterized protein n=1 Tax=Paramormyrops kingsleyae TaxID=1676925 RepID=UPI000CD5DF4C|nr:uncharacterized protein LOC111837513 [Paramormyrops kingsleyae]